MATWGVSSAQQWASYVQYVPFVHEISVAQLQTFSLSLPLQIVPKNGTVYSKTKSTTFSNRSEVWLWKHLNIRPICLVYHVLGNITICTEVTWLYCDYFIWFVSCTVAVLTCFVMCVCVCVCVCVYVCVGFVMCGFCNVWLCVCVGFVMCGCCNVWVL